MKKLKTLASVLISTVLASAGIFLLVATLAPKVAEASYLDLPGDNGNGRPTE